MSQGGRTLSPAIPVIGEPLHATQTSQPPLSVVTFWWQRWDTAKLR